MGWWGLGKATSANSRVPATCLVVWWWPCAGGWRPWWSRPPGCGPPHGTPSACWSQHPGSWSSLLDLLQQTKVTMPSHYREICVGERGRQTDREFSFGFYLQHTPVSKHKIQMYFMYKSIVCPCWPLTFTCSTSPSSPHCAPHSYTHVYSVTDRFP